MGFVATATLSAEQLRTGRRIQGDSLHARVQGWATSAIGGHSVEKEVIAALAAVSPMAPAELVCFRGQRRFPVGYRPDATEMGPPPSDNASGGRYNSEGCSVLYLAETTDGVARESIAGSGPLWVQKFIVPTSILRIADLRVGCTDDLLNQVFWLAEHAGEAPVYPGYRFSQRVASLVAERFDGMMVPGVRGDRCCRYANVIVLRQMSEWSSWLDLHSQPQLYGPVP